MRKKTDNIKADISLGATQKEREESVKRFRKIQKLLLHFNLSAFAYDPGARALIMHNRLGYIGHAAKYVDFDGDTWEFIEPLLKELLYLRMSRVRRLKRQMEKRRKYEGSSKRP